MVFQRELSVVLGSLLLPEANVAVVPPISDMLPVPDTGDVVPVFVVASFTVELKSQKASVVCAVAAMENMRIEATENNTFMHYEFASKVPAMH